MMLKGVKRMAMQALAGANVATILAMLVTGYAGMLNPDGAAWMSNAGLVFPIFVVVNIGFIVLWAVVKVRLVLLPFLGFLVCYQPMRLYCPLNFSATSTDGAIKVLSFNVWYFGDEEESDGTNTIIRYLAQSGADILCLQEALPQAGQQAQVDSLLSPLYPYCDSLTHNESSVVAVYSKYPILGKERIWYQSRGNLSGAFTLDINGEEVVVINNHLETNGFTLAEKSSFKEMVKGEMASDSARIETRRLIDKLGEAAKIRAPQARAVAEYIRKHAYQSILCVGDFNDGPLSYAHRKIADTLTDCFVAVGRGPGISYHHSGFFVRIDNIFCSADWEPLACKVDNQISASDHYPIICWLKKADKQ